MKKLFRVLEVITKSILIAGPLILFFWGIIELMISGSTAFKSTFITMILVECALVVIEVFLEEYNITDDYFVKKSEKNIDSEEDKL